ncbi:Yip1 family protein [archaeon]
MPRTKMEKLLMDPEKFFEKVVKEDVKEAWKYLAYWALLPAVVATIALGFLSVPLGGYVAMPTWLGDMLLGNTTLIGVALGIATGITIYVGIFIGVFVTAIVAHAVANVMKGRGKFEDSLKAIIYGTSPFYAFGWLPIFGPLFGLYSVIVQVPAFKALHRTKFVKAVMTVLGTLLIIGVLVGILPVLGGIFATGYHFGIVVNSIRGIISLMMM